MCGIFASFSKERLIELAKSNSYRGSYSWSITTLTQGEDSITISISKGLGQINTDQIIDDGYKICHIQAPTGSCNETNIHPAFDAATNTYLWHNGLVKSDDVLRLQTELNTTETWDTKLILRKFNEAKTFNDVSIELSEIDGSFACLFTDGQQLFAFRNEISPLFTNVLLDFSSVKVGEMYPVHENAIFRVGLFDSLFLEHLVDFKTKSNPYFFG